MEEKCKKILIAHYLERKPKIRELENLVKKVKTIYGTGEITFKYKKYAIILANNIIDVFKYGYGEYDNIEEYDANETYENIIKNFKEWL